MGGFWGWARRLAGLHGVAVFVMALTLTACADGPPQPPSDVLALDSNANDWVEDQNTQCWVNNTDGVFYDKVEWSGKACGNHALSGIGTVSFIMGTQPFETFAGQHVAGFTITQSIYGFGGQLATTPTEMQGKIVTGQYVNGFEDGQVTEKILYEGDPGVWDIRQTTQTMTHGARTGFGHTLRAWPDRNNDVELASYDVDGSDCPILNQKVDVTGPSGNDMGEYHWVTSHYDNSVLGYATINGGDPGCWDDTLVDSSFNQATAQVAETNYENQQAEQQQQQQQAEQQQQQQQQQADSSSSGTSPLMQGLGAVLGGVILAKTGDADLAAATMTASGISPDDTASAMAAVAPAAAADQMVAQAQQADNQAAAQQSAAAQAAATVQAAEPQPETTPQVVNSTVQTPQDDGSASAGKGPDFDASYNRSQCIKISAQAPGGMGGQIFTNTCGGKIEVVYCTLGSDSAYPCQPQTQTLGSYSFTDYNEAEWSVRDVPQSSSVPDGQTIALFACANDDDLTAPYLISPDPARGYCLRSP